MSSSITFSVGKRRNPQMWLILLMIVCFGQPALSKVPVSLDLKNPGKSENQRLKPYMISLRKRIQANWRPPAYHEYTAKMHYIIGTDGSLIELTTESSSRSTDFDNSATMAIQSNAPFSPPPVPHALVITATFDGKALSVSQAECNPPITGTLAPRWHQTNTFHTNDQARMPDSMVQGSQKYLPDVSPDPSLNMMPTQQKRLSALSAGKEVPTSRGNAFPPVAPSFDEADTSPASTLPEPNIEDRRQRVVNTKVASQQKIQRKEKLIHPESKTRVALKTDPRPVVKSIPRREMPTIQKNGYSRSWKAGDVAVILNPLSVGAVDLATFKDYWRSVEIGDTHGAATYIYAGKMVPVNQNSKVLILNSGSGYYRVRIRDIEHDLKNHNRVLFIKQSDTVPGHKSAVEQFRENMKRLK